MTEIEKKKRFQYAKNKKKGYNTERKVEELLYKLNIQAIRIPTSGHGYLRIYSNKGAFKDSLKRNYDNVMILPDVLAVDEVGKQLFAFQVKDTIKKEKYIEKKDLINLYNFHELFSKILENVRMFVIVRFSKYERVSLWQLKEIFTDTLNCKFEMEKANEEYVFMQIFEDVLRTKQKHLNSEVKK